MSYLLSDFRLTQLCTLTAGPQPPWSSLGLNHFLLIWTSTWVAYVLNYTGEDLYLGLVSQKTKLATGPLIIPVGPFYFLPTKFLKGFLVILIQNKNNFGWGGLEGQGRRLELFSESHNHVSKAHF